jgi:HD-GYP domain-containing protein (c-di-GMP phosphodiesterase class II)
MISSRDRKNNEHNPLKLQYPVYNLEKQLLLPAGSELSEETLEYLISLNKSPSNQKQPLLKYIIKDLISFLKVPPYNMIFSQQQLKEILIILEKVSVYTPVLQVLHYFKKHDACTYRHVLNTFALTTLVSRELISDDKDMIREVVSCPTHDIGKICVPLHILQKSSPLTPSELSMLRHHTVAGYVLLSYYFKDAQNFAAIIAMDHHERKDGSGYPRGKSLTDRMVEIVAASDIYDALISERPYRAASYDNRTALEEITGMAERKEIGWDVVRALVAFNRKDRPKFSDCEVSTQKRGVPPQGNSHGLITVENNGDAENDEYHEGELISAS